MLERFAGVFIKDSTVIPLPRASASVWQGLGDSQGTSAAVKLQVRGDLRTGQLAGPALQPARCHDRTTPYGIDDLPAGSVELADLGYFCLEELPAKQALGQYCVRRYKMRTEILTLEGEPLDLLAWLSQVQTEGERWVLLGERARLPVPLEARAHRARQRLYGDAGKKDGKPSQRALALAAWVVLIMNVPEAVLSARAVWLLARVRWQVAIVFRVWKSRFRVEACRRRNVGRVWCEWYAKLRGVVIGHRLLWVYRGGVWDRSLYKASCAFRRLSVVLWVCLRYGGSLEGVVSLFESCLVACRVGKCRRCPATFQLILESEGLT
jgi:hypothetical protein